MFVPLGGRLGPELLVPDPLPGVPPGSMTGSSTAPSTKSGSKLPNWNRSSKAELQVAILALPVPAIMKGLPDNVGKQCQIHLKILIVRAITGVNL